MSPLHACLALFGRFKVGDAFAQVSMEEAADRLTSIKGGMQMEVTMLEEKVKETEQLLGLLKVQLYGKFKNSINLERN